jgi:hypothetical protein
VVAWFTVVRVVYAPALVINVMPEGGWKSVTRYDDADDADDADNDNNDDDGDDDDEDDDGDEACRGEVGKQQQVFVHPKGTLVGDDVLANYCSTPAPSQYIEPKRLPTMNPVATLMKPHSSITPGVTPTSNERAMATY